MVKKRQERHSGQSSTKNVHGLDRKAQKTRTSHRRSRHLSSRFSARIDAKVAYINNKKIPVQRSYDEDSAEHDQTEEDSEGDVKMITCGDGADDDGDEDNGEVYDGENDNAMVEGEAPELKFITLKQPVCSIPLPMYEFPFEKDMLVYYADSLKGCNQLLQEHVFGANVQIVGLHVERDGRDVVLVEVCTGRITLLLHVCHFLLRPEGVTSKKKEVAVQREDRLRQLLCSKDILKVGISPLNDCRKLRKQCRTSYSSSSVLCVTDLYCAATPFLMEFTRSLAKPHQQEQPPPPPTSTTAPAADNATSSEKRQQFSLIPLDEWSAQLLEAPIERASGKWNSSVYSKELLTAAVAGAFIPLALFKVYQLCKMDSWSLEVAKQRSAVQIIGDGFRTLEGCVLDQQDRPIDVPGLSDSLLIIRNGVRNFRDLNNAIHSYPTVVHRSKIRDEREEQERQNVQNDTMDSQEERSESSDTDGEEEEESEEDNEQDDFQKDRTALANMCYYFHKLEQKDQRQNPKRRRKWNNKKPNLQPVNRGGRFRRERPAYDENEL